MTEWASSGTAPELSQTWLARHPNHLHLGFVNTGEHWRMISTATPHSRSAAETASALRLHENVAIGARMLANSSKSMSQRLPPNPRRRHVAPEQRKRVAKACNSCNLRRVKCSGDHPCQPCRRSSRTCEYPTTGPGQDASPSDDLRQLQLRCAALERCLQAVIPDQQSRQELLYRIGNEASPPDTDSPLTTEDGDDAETTEGRLLYDPDGTVRYLGETSGATFLDYLKQFMMTLIPLAFLDSASSTTEDGSTFVASIGQYQTWDSRPLLEPDVDPLWLPTRTETTMMLAELRYYVQDGNGDFPSGGIYYWGDLGSVPPTNLNYSSPNSTSTETELVRHLAFYHTAFAIASQISGQTLRGSDQHTGEAYFQRARLLLGNPLDTRRFTMSDVSTLALMGFYLIELNRRDFAYMYVSFAIHIAVTHGAHRYCVDEASKRIFWTLYILDKWLSCLMGRPPTIVDEAIRLALPADVPSLPPVAGLRAHIDLARITSHIVCNTYKIVPRGHNVISSTLQIDEAIHRLHGWLRQLPVSLHIPSQLPSADLACINLHMEYNQLVLLTTRPIFLIAVKKAVAERYIQSGQWRVEQHPQLRHLEACSEAAVRNIGLARSIVALTHTRRLLHAGLHYVFNAAIILLLKPLLHVSSTTAGIDVDFVIEIFEEECKTGSNYARDCCQVLQDLKALVHRYTSPNRRVSQPQNYILSTSESMSDAMAFSDRPLDQLDEPQGLHFQINESDDLYQELMAWMQNDDSQLYDSFLI